MRSPSRRFTASSAAPSLAVVSTLFAVAEFGCWLAMTIRAEQWGGVDEAALVLMVQLGPAACGALLVSRSIARFGARFVLLQSLTLFALAQVGLGLLMSSDDPIAGRYGLYAVAVASTVAAVPVRPAISAMLPDLLPDGERRARFQTWLGWCAAIGMSSGPVVVAISAGRPAVALWVFATLALCCAVLVAGVPQPRRTRGVQDRSRAASDPDTSRRRRPLRSLPGVRPVLALLCAESLLSGAADLLVVALPSAVSPAVVGWFSAAFGVGALIGGAAAGLLSRRRTASGWIAGLAVVAAGTTALLPVSDGTVRVAVLFLCLGLLLAAVAGLGRGVLQLLTPATATAQVFSTVELLDLLFLLAGVTAVPLLIAWFGTAGMALTLAAVVAAAVIPCLRAVLAAERQARRRSARVAVLVSIPELSDWSTIDLEALTAPSTGWHDLPVRVGADSETAR